MGGHPLWEIFRSGYRVTKKPYVLSAVALFLGYFGAYLKHDQRPVSDELMKFHRKEQMRRLKKILVSACTFKHIDKFELMSIDRPTRSATAQK